MFTWPNKYDGPVDASGSYYRGDSDISIIWRAVIIEGHISGTRKLERDGKIRGNCYNRKWDWPGIKLL